MSPVIFIIAFPVVGLGYFLTGLFVLLREPRKILHQRFFVLSLLLFLSCVAALSMQMETVISLPGRLEWTARITAILYMWLVFFLLRFTISLSEVRWKGYFWALAALIPLYLSTRMVFLDSACTFSRINGFVQYNDFHPLYKTMNLYMGLYLSFIIYILLTWYLRASMRKTKILAGILLGAQFLTMLMILLDAGLVLFPGSATRYMLPGALSFYFLPWYAGLGFAIHKLRVIVQARNYIDRKALSSLDLGILLLSPSFRIEWYNPCFAELLDTEAGLEGRKLSTILPGSVELESQLDQLRMQGKESISKRLEFLVGDGGSRLMETRFTMLVDEFGDIGAYLLVLDESRNMTFLKRQYGITPREAQVIQLIAEGRSNVAIARELKITERTVKSHITSIFNKMVVDNRVQLIMQLQRYRIFPKYPADHMAVSLG